MDKTSISQHGNNFDGKFFHVCEEYPMKKVMNSLIPNESRPTRVGPRVTALRETLALSKSQFADSIGLDRSTLTKVEKGTTGLDISKGEAICAIYGFGLDFIYRGDLSDVPDKYRPRLMVEMVTYLAM